jgi:chorismate dehydratase
MGVDAAHLAQQRGTAFRVGSVSFLNARPLIYGLDEAEDVELSLAVPSNLLDGLRNQAYDVALLPVIDYQRLPGLRLMDAGGIGSNGPTLTVRLFSPVPLGNLKAVAVDTDSHTSVVLARILLAECFGVRPEFIAWNPRRPDNVIPESAARLLIGDKVVCEEPVGLHHQMDLGEAWKNLTNLPFVFACWTARAGVKLGDLPQRLGKARQQGLQHVEEIVARHALPRGWPAALARRYLLENLKFEIGPQQIEAIALFHRLAYQHGLLEHQPWNLDIYPTPGE